MAFEVWMFDLDFSLFSVIKELATTRPQLRKRTFTSSSFTPQRDHRIDARGSPTGNEGRNEGHGQQKDGHGNECDCVVRPKPKHHAREHIGDGCTQNHTNDSANQDRAHGLPKHIAHDLNTISAQSHTNAYFTY
jgi:hypothetical protein